MSERIRVLFYVQHLLGIGHLTRASRIAEALHADGFDITVVTGGTPVEGFPAPQLNHVSLPVLAAANEGFSALADDRGQPASEDYKAARRTMLLSTYTAIRPEIVIFEAFPFGRRQMRFELLPLLDLIEDMSPRPLVVTSLRDILQERSKPGRDEETVELVRRHVDAVLVHGDPAFARLDETFPLAAEIADRVHYTGIVAPETIDPSSDAFDIVVSAGGGAVGQAVIAAAIAAAPRIDSATTWLLIAGPNLPVGDYAALEDRLAANARLVRFRKDFRGLLSRARLSISQAGYNTIGDILLAGCRSILVPFTTGGETEQDARATRLAALGRALVLPEPDLSGETLAQAVRDALALPDLAAIDLDRDGASATARILRHLYGLHTGGRD